ncbi:MAG: hypothetical protein C0392_16110, partial [Syntrophus sp. (in: bacteria)]|nr:hypothetical protein [Syntrophus sp. (in: bacteria)]
MNSADPENNLRRNRLHIAIIAAATITAILISIYCLSSGLFIVFQNLFYIPIILSCMYYITRGFIYSVCLAVLYMLLILVFTSENSIIMQALARVALFIVIAGVIAFLSARHTRIAKVLNESEERYHIAMEASNDGVAIVQNNIHVYVNRTFLKMFGYDTLDEIAWKHPYCIVHPDDYERVTQYAMARQNDKDVPIQYEFKGIKNDGTPIDIEASAKTILYKGEQAILAYLRDITERKKAEEVIKNNMRFQQVLMDAVPSPIFYKDAECVYMGGNKAFERYLGLSLEQFIGKTVYDISPVDLAEKYDKADRELLNNPGVQSYEASVVYADGTRHIVVFNKATFTDTKGKNAGLIGIILDITDRKKAEDKVKSLLAEKELLLKEVHHRIKNNMNVIISLLSLQASALKDPAAIAALTDSGSRVRSMMVLYDKLYRSTDFREISTKGYLTSLINEIIANFSNQGMVTIETQIDDLILDAKTLSPVGMIVNELLTNIMKHAFPEEMFNEKMFNVQSSTFNVREPAKITVTLTEKQDADTPSSVIASTPPFVIARNEVTKQSMSAERDCHAPQGSLAMTESGKGSLAMTGSDEGSLAMTGSDEGSLAMTGSDEGSLAMTESGKGKGSLAMTESDGCSLPQDSEPRTLNVEHRTLAKQ